MEGLELMRSRLAGPTVGCIHVSFFGSAAIAKQAKPKHRWVKRLAVRILECAFMFGEAREHLDGVSCSQAEGLERPAAEDLERL